MAKKGPKGPRPKVRRVLFVSGHPDSLYDNATGVSYTLTWKDKTYSLGHCGEEMAKALKEMNTYAQVNRIEKPQKRLKLAGVSYGNGISVSIKKVGENTHIIVNAVDENGLNEGVGRISKDLKGQGLDVIERCHWSCDYDGKSPPGKITPTPTPMPVKLPDGPGKFFCKVHGKEILMPRDCDYCIMKKQCGEFEEFKKKMEIDKNAIGP